MKKEAFKRIDRVGKFWVRPGNYFLNGATIVDGGVNFTVQSFHAVGCELLLFHRMQEEPYAVIPFPESYRIGNTYAMIVFDLDIFDFEYAYRIIEYAEDGVTLQRTGFLLDPYAKAITGQSVWGEKPHAGFCYKARVVDDDFEWGNFKQPELPFSDLIIYEIHVRGFTKHASSGVKNPGMFAGILEKLPYLLELGVNAVELMPIFEFDEMEAERIVDGQELVNFWGYNTVGFFAPNTSYTAATEYNHEGNELKNLIKTLNENGIEVILDVVFNHTAEGDERGETFSFKGFDKDIYYMLTPDGKFFNFSGCGNTMNCNHPVVRRMILDCLRHWVIEYRVDGFRFDLASILGRDKDGMPMHNPPLLESLAFDPILSRVKLIAEAWDAGGLYQVGSFPSWNRWAEWNGKYRDDLRRFLKGDGGMAEVAVKRIMGSSDIYDPQVRQNASVNFLTCHDGFPLYDIYAYNNKHNEENGWDNTDGENHNNSWNCGEEGETDNEEVNKLRDRMRKNAFLVLMCSRGACMFLAGDEFCNTQFGNNNAYCQDNEISWLIWSRAKQYPDMQDFCKRMIAFRKKHPIVRKKTDKADCGLPDMSIHNFNAWDANFHFETHTVGIMFAGRNAENTTDDIVYLGINAFWEQVEANLPILPEEMMWKEAIKTGEQTSLIGEYNKIVMSPRSTILLEAVYKHTQ